ncbi:hypothetical protein KY289_000766 [Solanum tuberosum]|uniref:Uncharacterized protein n=1 Tax=Solanum tuberosum TaxID=4113 RepID=M1DIK3_SOLTU|nr:hypothetical protein KY289_000766 [Solanum tuberosum]
MEQQDNFLLQKVEEQSRHDKEIGSTSSKSNYKDKVIMPLRGQSISDSKIMESHNEISNAESKHIGIAIRERNREANYTNNTAMEINIENKEENTNVQDEHQKLRGTPEEKTPRIDKMHPIEVNKKQDEEQEDYLEEYIEKIGREGDLSPRKIGKLKGRHKEKYNSTVPLQIHTRNRKGESSSSDQ